MICSVMAEPIALTSLRMTLIATRILTSKIVHKNCPIQCTLRVIACTQQCVEGVQMNWSIFLLNHLNEDVVVVQVEVRPYTYRWLLI